MYRTLLSTLILLAIATSACLADPVFSTVEDAMEHPDFPVQGEYVGQLQIGDTSVRVGFQVAALGDGDFRSIAWPGGLPGDGWHPDNETATAETSRDASDRIRFDYDPFTAEYQPDEQAFVVRHPERGEVGQLEKVYRESPAAGKEPPEGADVLFDGSSLDAWRDGASMTDDNLLTEGAVSRLEFEDAIIHVEFMLGFMPNHSGQGRANSGAYIQNRYEVQILDSFAELPSISGAASLYNEREPDLNASYPPLQWQTYTIHFTAPRFDEDGEKTANARFTVEHNGVVVHDDVQLPHGTGAGQARGEGGPGPLLLQDHGGDPVRFRNVWIKQN